MAESDSSGVEEMYRNFGVLADAADKVSEHPEAFEGIVKAAKGSSGEKKLAAGFITRFFRHFPELADSAMDAMLDLIEDEDPMIRHSAIKSLPDICKGSSDPTLCTRVADVLTQLLPTDDPVDLNHVKTGMAAVLQIDTQHALQGIFGQIMGEDEGVREKALDYLSSSLMSMRHKLFLTNQDNEKCLMEHVRKVLADVTGEEFETLMEVLGRLQYLSTPEGSQAIGEIISEQAELSSEFQPTDTESIDRFATCFRQALKFCKRGSSPAPFLRYLSSQILPQLSAVPEEPSRQELLRLLAEGCLYETEEACAQDCILPIFNFLVEHMPLPPAEEGEPPKLQFSAVECALFSFHRLVKEMPEFLAADDNAERFKDFRQRLQYFARGSQSYHAQLQAALKGKNTLELKDEQNKLRTVALKTTANISALIRDFFHNPPSYKATVQLSWGAKKPDSVPGPRKRATSSSDGATPPKRKPSPIRFEGGASQEPKSSRKQDRSLYEFPKGRFSKDISNGDFEQSQDGRGYRGRGRGSRRGRFGKRRGGSWREYS